MMKFVLMIGTVLLYGTPGLSYHNFFHSGQTSHPSYWHHGMNFENDNSRFPAHETQYPFMDYNTPFDELVEPPEIALCQCLRQCDTPRDEYPVCGTNHFTYANIEQLICSRECGVDVDLLQRGRCPSKGNYYSKPFIPSKNPTEFTTPVLPTELVTPSGVDNMYSPQINNCKRQCFTIAPYDPVCGTDYVLYYNSQLLRCIRNCGVDVDIMHHGKCPTKGYNYPKPTPLPMKPTGAPKPYQPTEYIPPLTSDKKYSSRINGCNRMCSTTSPYDPVCGTDYILYYNSAILGCARQCGIDVAFLQLGSCPAVPLSIGDTVPPATDDVHSPTTYDDVPTNGGDVPSTTVAVVPPTTDDFVVKITGGYIPPTGGDMPPTGGDVMPPNTSDKTDNQPQVTDDSIKQCLLNCRSGLEYYPYTPVCGTNNIQYDNQRHVLCAKKCGIDVKILHAGVCTSANDIFTEAPSPISSGSESPVPNTSTKLPPELNFDVRIKEEMNNSTK